MPRGFTIPPHSRVPVNGSTLTRARGNLGVPFTPPAARDLSASGRLPRDGPYTGCAHALRRHAGSACCVPWVSEAVDHLPGASNIATYIAVQSPTDLLRIKRGPWEGAKQKDIEVINVRTPPSADAPSCLRIDPPSLDSSSSISQAAARLGRPPSVSRA